ncbi:MAG: hypothetical protein ACFB20_00790 [Opitutales bacterium]
MSTLPLLPVFQATCYVAFALLPLTAGLFLLCTSRDRLLERFSAVVYGLTGHAGDYREVRAGKRVCIYLRATGATALAVGLLVASYIVSPLLTNAIV